MVMTKSDEIDLLNRSIDKMPHTGYGVLLRHLISQFEQNVRNDSDTFPDIREMEQTLQALHAETNKARRESDEIKHEILHLQQRRQFIKDELRKLRDSLERISL